MKIYENLFNLLSCSEDIFRKKNGNINKYGFLRKKIVKIEFNTYIQKQNSLIEKIYKINDSCYRAKWYDQGFL